MSITKRKLIISSMLSVGLIMSALSFSTVVKAEEEIGIDEIIDFSIDLDDLPPQPSQVSGEVADSFTVPDVEEIVPEPIEFVSDSMEGAVTKRGVLASDVAAAKAAVAAAKEEAVKDAVSEVSDTTVQGTVTQGIETKLTDIKEQVQAQEQDNVNIIVDAPNPSPVPSTPLSTIDTVSVGGGVVDPLGVDAKSEGNFNPATHSGLYYDADSFVPSASLRGRGPREVDPRYEPASRFVIVKPASGPNSTAARVVAAQRALKLGRYTAALEIGEELYKKRPKDKQVLMGLAVAQQYSGFTESAIATYEELLAIDPKNTDAMVNMLGLVKSHYPAVAYRKLKDMWSKNSLNPGLAAQLGITSASLGDYEEALHFLSIAVSIDPNNASHYYNMAVVSDQAGAYKDAVDLYQKSLEVDVVYGGSRSVPRTQIYDRLAHLRRL